MSILCKSMQDQTHSGYDSSKKQEESSVNAISKMMSPCRLLNGREGTQVNAGISNPAAQVRPDASKTEKQAIKLLQHARNKQSGMISNNSVN
jgi:hypothetical protein